MARSVSESVQASASPGPAGRNPAESDTLSIVICTKDRPGDLARAIASIRASGLAGRTAEIVVVEETDEARALTGIRYIRLPRQGLGFGHARNIGLREAKGNLILFMDDDCHAAQGWVEALIEPFRTDPQVLGVAGAVLVRDCGLIGYAENILGFPGGGLRYIYESQGQVVPTRYLSTCNCAYRREAILRAGGFTQEARYGSEDSLLAERVAALGVCVYNPKAVVYHRARGQLGAVVRWFIRRGQSEVGFLRTTEEPWRSVWYQIRSSWMLRSLLVLLILVRWPGFWLFLPVGGILYYGIMLWRFRFARAHSMHRQAWWVVPVVKIAMDLGMEVGRWKAWLTR